jgi:hypothetical protein
MNYSTGPCCFLGYGPQRGRRETTGEPATNRETASQITCDGDAALPILMESGLGHVVALEVK